MGRVWKLLRSWADDRPGGMNESQIARAVGVDAQLVHKWKTGTRPSPANLAKIAHATGLDYEHQLVPALLFDLGYLPVEQVMGNAQHPAPIVIEDLEAALADIEGIPEDQRVEIIKTIREKDHRLRVERPTKTKRKTG